MGFFSRFGTGKPPAGNGGGGGGGGGGGDGLDPIGGQSVGPSGTSGGLRSSAPRKPTLTLGFRAPTSAGLSGSPYASPSNSSRHTSSQWIVALAGTATPVIDTGWLTTDRLAHVATPLLADTLYRAAVRYQDQLGQMTPWSDDLVFRTKAKPFTPTLTVSAVTDRGCTMTGSPFTDPDTEDSAAHAASRWQIDVTAGDFSAPAFDSQWTTSTLSLTVANVLSLSTSYKARVAYQEQDGQISDWSVPVGFSTKGAPSIPVLSLALRATTRVDVSLTSVDADGDALPTSRWQLDLATGSFTAPLFDSGVTSDQHTTRSFTGLAPNTAYVIRAMTFDTDGNGSPWSTALAATTKSVPSAPTITSGARAETSIGLVGSAYSDVDGDPQASAQWQLTAASDTTFASPVYDSTWDAVHLTSITVSNLTPLTSYLARVRYQDPDGNMSPWSAAIATGTKSAPDTPTVTLVSHTNSSISLQSSAFHDSDGDTHGSSDWQVTTANDTAFASPGVNIVQSANYLTSLIVSGLASQTNFLVRVRYHDSDGTPSAWSTPLPCSTRSMPNAPTLSATSQNDSGFTVAGSAFSSVDPDATFGAALFQVAAAGDPTFASPIAASGWGAAQSITQTGLPQSTSYYVRAQYRDQFGNTSAWSAVLTIATKGSPGTPTLTVSSRTPTGATLQGSAYTDPDNDPEVAARWMVTLATDTAFSAPVVDTGWDGAHLSTFNATGLTMATDYLARVAYEDANGPGGWSPAVGFRTKAPPAAPTLATGTIQYNSAALVGGTYSDPDGDLQHAAQWQVTASNDTGYAVPAVDSGTDTTHLSGYTATPLAQLSSYIARVRYQDADLLWSPWSASVAFTTPAQPPATAVRTQQGLLFSDSFTRTTLGSDWAPQDASGTPTLANNRIEWVPPGYFAHINAVGGSANADFAETFVQMRLGTSAPFNQVHPGIYALQSSGAGGRSNYSWRTMYGNNPYWVLSKSVNGTQTDLVVLQNQSFGSSGNLYLFGLHAKSGLQRAYVNGGLAASATDTSVTLPGRSGLQVMADGGSNTAYADDFLMMRSPYVSIGGIPSGGRGAVENNDATVSYPAAGPTALIDCKGGPYPFTRISVWDAQGVLICTVNADSGGVFGGDTWNVTTGPYGGDWAHKEIWDPTYFSSGYLIGAYDYRYGVTLDGSNRVTRWADARGATGYGAALTNTNSSGPAFVAGTGLTFSGTTQLSALFGQPTNVHVVLVCTINGTQANKDLVSWGNASFRMRINGADLVTMSNSFPGSAFAATHAGRVNAADGKVRMLHGYRTASALYARADNGTDTGWAVNGGNGAGWATDNTFTIGGSFGASFTLKQILIFSGSPTPTDNGYIDGAAVARHGASLLA